jgi:hypothetical protein
MPRGPRGQKRRASDRLWSMDVVVALIDAAECKPKKRGPYKRASRLKSKLSHYPRRGRYGQAPWNKQNLTPGKSSTLGRLG